MANETRGVMYEAIAGEALRRATKLAGIDSEVFWNQKPVDMNIIPDFTIGKVPDEPTHVVLVTASGSAKETDKKFWRNAGELQEVKAQLSKPPTVINLYFESIIKAGLGETSLALYDKTIHVDHQTYHKPLAQWVHANIRNSAKNREAKQQLLQEAIAQDTDLAAAMEALAADLANALQQRNLELEPLWQLMREDYLKPHYVPTARKTSVRRGLAKLLVLEPKVRQALYVSGTRVRGIPAAGLPDYVYQLEILRKNIVGVRIVDAEVSTALELLGPEKCEAVLTKAPASMDSWLRPLRNLPRVNTHVGFIEERYDEITDPVGLYDLLTECYQDPSALSGEVSDNKVWLFEIMVSLLKAKSGKLQGYGLAQLAEDTKTPEFGQGGFLIPPYVQRTKPLTTEHLEALAGGLSLRFRSAIAADDLPKLKKEVVTWVIKENLEDRLIPYRNFEPLLWLLEDELEAQGKLYAERQAYTGWINEYSGVGRSTATTPFVQVGTTLIHWKSVSDAGKGHKKKELAARARNVKYQYHPATKTFSRRKGVEQLALIVDGTFGDEDLDVLAKAGWDVIVYPDEIFELVNRI